MSSAAIDETLTSAGPMASTATEAGTDDATWARFAAAGETAELVPLWLSLLCAQVGAARSAVVLLGAADRGPFTPAAVWPHTGHSVVHLTEAAERTLRERRGLVLRRGENGETRLDLTYPVTAAGTLRGALVLETPDLAPGALQRVLRQVHWGIAHLELSLLRQGARSEEDSRSRVFTVLDLVAVAVEEERFQAAATALVSELARRLDCDRVSLGLERGSRMRVEAISHNATFGRQMNLTRLIEAAMDEAVDQEAAVRYPPPDDSRITLAHQALAQQQAAEELCTVPLAIRGAFVAALTLERPRGRPLTPLEQDLCQTAGELAGPILLCKREHERWLITKVWDAGRRQLTRLFGPRYLGRKLLALALAAIVAFLALATGTYRVTAKGILEGGELRAVVAPFNGFIERGERRAGESVQAGELLAALDDRDLKLEQVRLSTESAQYQRERRQAVADHDRARARILTAQIQQAQAQLALIEEQLARTRVSAPFDGVLVSGDLTQSLGAPVQQGDLLFELVPTGQYRLELQVAERDIDDIAVGQTGTLVLAALPETPIGFTLSLITPVTAVTEGRNTFAVEATLHEVPERLRPGMEGVGKVEIGERRLVWIWTRGFLHWARLKLWAWWP